MRRLLLALALLLAPAAPTAARAQVQTHDLVILGGWLFTSTDTVRIHNPGILIRAGKFQRVGGDLSEVQPGADTIRLSDDETITPGLFDLHAHYHIQLFGNGRVDETKAYPSLFLANGVTSTWPAGEMNADSMRALRIRIDRGLEPGPRLLNSGPYFGTARPGWPRNISVDSIYEEVDHWAELGVKGFKAKGIAPYQLRALIERAHVHGLTVTGHLDSGWHGTVNPRDAILMGIDRIEHFMGGDAYPADRSAYASLENFTDSTFRSPAYQREFQLFIQHHVYYDATLSAYGYFGKRDPQVFAYFTDEKRFLTPYARRIVDSRPPRPPIEQFEKIYWVKRKEIKAFYDAGGKDLITLGTDHPSWGEWFTPFSVHRELLSFVLSGIPPYAALRFATINAAHAMGLGDRLGSIETGKWADAVIVNGNPLADIRVMRFPRAVIKAGVVYDPTKLENAVVGTIGPATPADTIFWLGGTKGVFR
ncbi:MAG: amidohydrolase family protein [Gemmatimonadota bacterium]|nr:amidohydrolase family protein [Gemmatimonadota bacterium]MDE3215751.1 amidohydrolase family protein [Gemmatimonadota bacterium]